MPSSELPSFYSLLRRFLSDLEEYSLNACSRADHTTYSVQALREHILAILQKADPFGQAEPVAYPNALPLTTAHADGEILSIPPFSSLDSLGVQQKGPGSQERRLEPQSECVESTIDTSDPHEPPNPDYSRSAPLAGSTTTSGCNDNSSKLSGSLPSPVSRMQTTRELEAHSDPSEMSSEAIDHVVQEMIDFVQEDLQEDPGTQDAAVTQAPQDQSIQHSIADGVITFRPKQEQWPCFQQVLHSAVQLGAEEAGVFKIHLSHLEYSQNVQPKSKAWSYKTQLRKNGTVGITTEESDFIDLPPDQTLQNLSASEAAERLERKLASSETLGESRCRTDLPVRTDEDRANMGLPVSPIWPIQSSKLSRTKCRVPGIHWPYAYRANARLGAVFVLHVEDFALYSLNLLYEGRKIWIIVPPSEQDKLESILRNRRTTPKCAQFVRETATYVPTHVLKQWNVHFRVVQQDPGDVIVTLPRAYHEGFSVGILLAEAVNYADDDWNPDQYNACTADTCPAGFIGRDLMTLLGDEEEQVSAGEENPSEFGSRSYSDAESNLVEDGSQGTEKDTRQLRGKASRSRAQRTKVPAKQAKRKEPPVRYKQPAKKSHSVAQLSSNLNNVLMPPKTSVEGVFQDFQRLGASAGLEHNDSRCCLLTKIFLAIGSPDAIYQLRGAYATAQMTRGELISTKKSFADSIRALDMLDSSIHLYAVLRRFHLVSLCRQRDSLLAETRQTRQSNFRYNGTSQSLAHKKLMAHAYPGLLPASTKNPDGTDEYARKSKALTRFLMIGQRWSMLGNAFTLGILALLPTQGDYQVSNSDYESLPAAAIGVLIDVLKRHRGAFLREISECLRLFTQPSIEYSFINEDVDEVKQQEYDSPRLVELCKLHAEGDLNVPDQD